MKIRVSNSLFVILVSAVLWQPVSPAADSYDPPARVGSVGKAVSTEGAPTQGRNEESL
jgi:hypothetical protein